MKQIIALLLIVLCQLSGYGLTWDEPWQEEILKHSDYFILGRVIDAKPGAVRIKVLKQFGKLKIEEEITLEGFHLLSICSHSDSDKVTFFFQMIDSVYLFLKKTEIGYCLPTPTSGYAIVAGGKVLSTFRHSFHQAHLSVPIYELCMGAIWNTYKGIAYDKKPVEQFIQKNLSRPAAGFSDKEIDLFFRQHAALEIIYHCKISDNFLLLLPFASCSNNHLVISALRCLSNFNTAESRSLLLTTLGDKKQSDFTKVIAARSLKNIMIQDIKKEVEILRDNAGTESVNFSSNIMDPRICTTLPSVKTSLEEVLTTVTKN